MVNKYEIQLKEDLPVGENLTPFITGEVFLSSFDGSERVQSVFDRISKKKYWAIATEYDHIKEELPTGNLIDLCKHDEAKAVAQLLDSVGADGRKKLCIDITGFIRPHIIFLLKSLKFRGYSDVEVIYSEPMSYQSRESTKFTTSSVHNIRQVLGFEGSHNLADISNDYLIIAAGYEHELMARVAENKNHCKKISLFGFPSLRPEMYHENRCQVSLASEALGEHEGTGHDKYFAPAYDPFITAAVLDKIVSEINRKKEFTNLYLCPLSTKPQVLGFTLFYLSELESKACSIVYPFCESVGKATSKGISRIWKYSVEL